MPKKITIKNAAAQVREHLKNKDSDWYDKSGIADSSDEYVAYEILGKSESDFLQEDASTTATTKQPVDNTVLTEQPDVIKDVVSDTSTTKLAPSDTSTIESGNDLGPLTSTAPLPKFPFSSFLDTNNPAEQLLNEELKSTVANSQFEDEQGNIVDLTSKEVFSPTSPDSNSYRLSHTVDDLDYQETVKAAEDGKIAPTDKLTGLVGKKEEVPFDTANSELNRKNLLAANEDVVETSRDSILKHPNGEPLKVKLAETAARRFESAYTELEGKGIELQVSSALVPYNVQMQNYQRYLENKKAGKNVAFVAHPDSSFHTAGYAVDLARDGRDGKFGMEENIEEIAEVMKRHGWNQHPDEWWHFSVDRLDRVLNPKEEDKSGVVDLKQTKEEDALDIISIEPTNFTELELWESEDGKIKLFDGGMSQAQILDYHIEESHPEIANIITKAGISLNVDKPGIFGNRIDATTTAQIMFKDMDPELIKKAKKQFQTQLREEWLASSPKIDPLTNNYELTPEQYKKIYDNQISGSKKIGESFLPDNWGFAWKRVFTRAYDNSLSGNIYAQRHNLQMSHISTIDNMLVSKGVMPELNNFENGMAAVLTFMMPYDATLMAAVLASSGPVAAAAMKTPAGIPTVRWLTNFAVKHGAAKGKNAETVVRKIVRHAMTLENGVGLFRASQVFGLYDASLTASVQPWGEDPVMINKLDSLGNLTFDESGRPYQEVDPNSKGSKIWAAYLHGMGMGALLHSTNIFIGKPIANRMLKSDLPYFLNNRATQTIASVIPEWLVFTGASYKDADKHARTGVRHQLNVEGNLNPTNEEVNARYQEQGGSLKTAKQSAIDAASFILIMRSMSAAFPATMKALQKPEISIAKKQALAQKVHNAHIKNPEKPLADIIIEVGRLEGINMEGEVGTHSLHNIQNLKIGKDGKPIFNPEIYPEIEVRKIAEAMGIKEHKKIPIKELIEQVYELDQRMFKEFVLKKYQQQELDKVGDRKGLSEIDKANHIIDAEKIINDKNISPEKAAKLLVEEQLEFGFTPLESSASIKKITSSVKKQIVEVEVKEPLAPKETVKTPIKKPLTAKQKATKAAKVAKAESNKIEKEERVKTRAEKKKIDAINKSAQKQLEKIQAQVEEAVFLQENNIKQVDVKSSKDIKKPHGFKELTEIIDGKEVPLMGGIFKGKKVFDNIAQFEAWRAKLPKKFSDTVAVLVKKAQGGKVTAQAFVKSTPDVKMVGGKETKGPGLVDKQRHQMDAEYALAMTRLEDFGDVRQLRDPSRQAYGQMEKCYEYVQQIDILQKQRINMNQELLEYQLRKKSKPIGEFELQYEINPGKEYIIALKNSAHATNATIKSHKRQINRILSNEVLAKNISKKMILLSKKMGVELTNPKATAKGFIDWSGGKKPDTMNQTVLDLLKEDIIIDLTEYVSRAFSKSNKSLAQLSPTEIGRMLAEHHGLPKKTVTDVIKSIGMEDVRRLIRAEQTAATIEKMNLRPIDKTLPESTVPVTKEMQSVLKIYAKHFNIDIEKAGMLLELVDSMEGTKPNNVPGILDAKIVRPTATFEQQIERLGNPKKLAKIDELWTALHNYPRGGKDALTGFKEAFDDLPLVAVYNNMKMAQSIMANLDKPKVHSKTFEKDHEAALNKHQAISQTVENFDSTIGSTLRNIGNIGFTDKMLQKMSGKFGIDMTDDRFQILTNNKRFNPEGRDKNFKPTSAPEIIIDQILNAGEAGLEWYRAMLLMSFGPTVKAVFGDTMHSFGMRAVDGIDRMVFRTGKNSTISKLDALDKKYKGNALIEAKTKVLREAVDSGKLTNEWFEMEYADIAEKRTYKMLRDETKTIMMEMLADGSELNPLIGLEWRAGSAGISSNLQRYSSNPNSPATKGLKIFDAAVNATGLVVRGWGQNWMGAIDNAYRQPFKMREFHRLAMHEGITDFIKLNEGKVPDMRKLKDRNQVMENVDNILKDTTGKQYIRISESANAYASRVTFQDKFYSDFAQKLSSFRIASNNQPTTRALAIVSNLAVPFLVSNVNAWKIANEWLPTAPLTPSFWGDMATAYPETVGKYLGAFKVFAPLDRRFGGSPNAAALAKGEIRKRFMKMALGGGTILSMATVFMKLREAENVEDADKIQYDNQFDIMIRKKQQYEAVNLKRGMGIQSDGIPATTAPLSFLTGDDWEGTGSWTFKGADPLSTFLNVMDPTYQFANAATQEMKIAAKKSIEAFESVVPGYTKAVTKIADARESGNEKEYDASIWDYVKVMANGVEDSPPLQLWDTINKSTDPNNPNHGRVWDLFRGKIMSNFENPTVLRQLLRGRYGKHFQQYQKEQYDENGLMFTTAEHYGITIPFLEKATGVSQRDILKSVGMRSPMYDNIAFQDKPRLADAELMEMEEARGFTFESIAALTEYNAEEIERQIEMPYSTVGFTQIKGSEKFPTITILGDFIPQGGGIERFFGLNLVKNSNDEASNELTKEYLWLESQKASLQSVFGDDPSISIELFNVSPEEKGIIDNNMAPYKATMKLDEKDNFRRRKMIGDLYKQKMSSILLDKESLLGISYKRIKDEISKNTKELESIEDKNSTEYMNLDGLRQRHIGELAGIWNTTARSIRHVVDYTVFGEEFNNMKFWRDHMDTYTNNQGNLKLEFQALYPEATPEECKQLAKDFQEVSNTPSYSGSKRNMMYSEIYRKWAKSKGIDRDHIMDEDNIANMARGLEGNDMIPQNNAYQLDLTDEKRKSLGRNTGAIEKATELPKKSWNDEDYPKRRKGLGKFSLKRDYGFQLNDGTKESSKIFSNQHQYSINADTGTDEFGYPTDANDYQKRTKGSNILSKIKQFKK